ncbi:DNA-directed DNA polymerase [Senna tora]|uniref:DNA-directed DNA polymerase n=1 Tax=Senna tora TaxID=362788 RepID=A0A834SDA1_9FABA|nr:DNA-directed DNA polymerase [Senna tora]
MTTGRINQVAILFRHVAPPTPLPGVMPGRSLHDEGNRLPRILSYIKGTCKGINQPSAFTACTASETIEGPLGPPSLMTIAWDGTRATSNTLIDVGKGELTMRIPDAHVTFNMLNPIKSPKENEKSLKIEAAKERVSKTAIDGDLNNHQIDPGEKSQKYLTEIDAADQFGGPTMLKAPPWCNKSKSPHHINQELPFTPGVQKNITGRDTRNWDSCKVTSTPCSLIDPG